MIVKHAEIGVCGLSCRLCPMYHSEGASRCFGCKTESRMRVGCPFITCALKKKGVEFCWDCAEKSACNRWKKHRESGKKADSFKCYQKLEDDIAFAEKNGIEAFEKTQETRERLLKKMLQGYNEGRSKSYYCIAATVFGVDELEKALCEAEKTPAGLDVKERSKVLHRVLEEKAKERGYLLKLRR